MKINHRYNITKNKGYYDGYNTPRLNVRYSDRCNKMAYDKKGAISAKNKRYKEDHIKLREYHCGKCNAWHLTKTDKITHDCNPYYDTE